MASRVHLDIGGARLGPLLSCILCLTVTGVATPAEEPTSVIGRIMDSDGNPLRGRIEAFAQETEQQRSDRLLEHRYAVLPAASVETDSAGRFELPLPGPGPSGSR